eukprot:CAMPEP_0174268416 /NCGR_PEP_ID=MMETSP0439-20130205/37332_1 /TAXON_ID=0 /ORGANISM="Stereomyxa ramosa, Strain Chinc5" /LENGTH=68 /DNA_ID=CAMNT_0015356565 /DNA_START=93 /DNA_END=295 /DNA_ORIENTATION=-
MPPHVYPQQVPVRIRNLDKLVDQEWDLTLQQVVPFIDGVRHISKIAAESHVHLQLVEECMRHLLYYKA